VSTLVIHFRWAGNKGSMGDDWPLTTDQIINPSYLFFLLWPAHQIWTSSTV